MFSKIKPRVHSKDLLLRGTDLNASERFQKTLSYNHFTTKDQENLNEIYKKIQQYTPSMYEIFNNFLQEISSTNYNPLKKAEIENYLTRFFTSERNDDYVKKL